MTILQFIYCLSEAESLTRQSKRIKHKTDEEWTDFFSSVAVFVFVSIRELICCCSFRTMIGMMASSKRICRSESTQTVCTSNIGIYGKVVQSEWFEPLEHVDFVVVVLFLYPTNLNIPCFYYNTSFFIGAFERKKVREIRGYLTC